MGEKIKQGNNLEETTQKSINERLKQDLEMLFSYARVHSVSKNPLDEQEMIHIINLKEEVFKRLFPQEEG
jgi:hypothetical protein